MTFRSLVRRGHVKGPVQTAFSEDEWRKAGSAIPADAVDDQQLFRAGLWFASRLAPLRDAVSALSTSTGIPRERAMRLAIAMVNRDAAVAIDRANVAMAASAVGDVVMANAALEFTLELAAGGKVSPAAFAESLVDGLRFELTRLANLRCVGESIVDPLAQAQFATNASVMYDMLERLWSDCVWNNYYVTEGDVDILQPSDLVRARGDAVSEYRRDSLLMESVGQAYRAFSSLPAELKAQERARQRVIAVERTKKGLRVRLGRGGEDPGPQLIARISVEEPYLQSLMDMPLPNWDNLRVRDLLDAWQFVLAPLAGLLRARLPRQRVSNVRDLEAFAPALSRRDLEQALQSALRCNTRVARSVLERFIWTPSPRSSLWYTPFLAIGQDLLLPVIPALESPNLFRSVEYWMSEGGLGLDDRGPYFEAALRTEAQSWFVERDPAFRSGGVVPHSVHNEADGLPDLDAVIWIGDTVLICELKCQKYPASAIEESRYRERLMDAAGQLRKRRSALERDPLPLVRVLREYGYPGPDRPRFAYAIVVNTPLGTLQSIDGFPVVDELILRRYFYDGKGEMFAVMSRDGDSASTPLPFYRDEADAAARLGGYLEAPPHLVIYREFIKQELVPLLRLRGQRPAAYVHFAVKLGSGHDEGFLASAGLADRIGESGEAT